MISTQGSSDIFQMYLGKSVVLKILSNDQIKSKWNSSGQIKGAMYGEKGTVEERHNSVLEEYSIYVVAQLTFWFGLCARTEILLQRRV